MKNPLRCAECRESPAPVHVEDAPPGLGSMGFEFCTEEHAEKFFTERLRLTPDQMWVTRSAAAVS